MTEAEISKRIEELRREDTKITDRLADCEFEISDLQAEVEQLEERLASIEEEMEELLYLTPDEGSVRDSTDPQQLSWIE